MAFAAKLGLGTVQFGMDYGISNRAGRPAEAEVAGILARAADAGIEVLDTAAAYGEAEAVLGRALWSDHPFRIVTKVPSLPKGPVTAHSVARLGATFTRSLSHLGAERVYGLLVHNAANLLVSSGDRLFGLLAGLKAQGRVAKIGVSVYSVDQARAVTDRFPLDLIQLPVNVFDQRPVVSGLLADLKAQGIEVHARSVFLQGLLLMDPDDLPAHFASARERIRDYADHLTAAGVSPLRAALGYVMGTAEVDVALCGVTTREELEQILGAVGKGPAAVPYERFAMTDEDVINPVRWPPRGA